MPFYFGKLVLEQWINMLYLIDTLNHELPLYQKSRMLLKPIVFLLMKTEKVQLI